MIPQLLEAKIIEAIGAALPQAHELPVQIFGAWQPATIGYLKNQEEADVVATIAIALGTQARATYTTGEVSFSGKIALTVRIERDTTGNALLTLAGAIESLLRSWQAETYQQALHALSVEGFAANEISFTGGTPPQMNFGAKTVTVDWPFTITGCDD